MPSLPSPEELFAGILFGSIGLVVFRQGRRQENVRRWCIGLALILYPYLVSGSVLTWGVGLLLCLSLFFL